MLQGLVDVSLVKGRERVRHMSERGFRVPALDNITASMELIKQV
jgi:hypothetical protein